MKRILSTILAAVLLFAFTTPSARAAGVSIYIDGVEVRTEQLNHRFPADDWVEVEPGHIVQGIHEMPSSYYMDVQPEVNSGRVFVPVRAISVFFDAKVDWQKPNVFILHGDTALTLTIGSVTVINNETESTLETAPYIKDGRTMVPLRFISEAFSCEVDYADGNVYINTPPLSVDRTDVVSVQSWYGMTMGGVRSESKTNICMTKLYQFLKNGLGDEIEPPEFYGTGMNTVTPNYYFHNLEISFMESEGLDGVIIRQYDIFARTNDSPDWIASANAIGIEKGPDLGKWIVYDATNDSWYKVAVADFLFHRLDIYIIGYWEVILNDIV